VLTEAQFLARELDQCPEPLAFIEANMEGPEAAMVAEV
jgi:hypothetical protein